MVQQLTKELSYYIRLLLHVSGSRKASVCRGHPYAMQNLDQDYCRLYIGDDVLSSLSTIWIDLFEQILHYIGRNIESITSKWVPHCSVPIWWSWPLYMSKNHLTCSLQGIYRNSSACSPIKTMCLQTAQKCASTNFMVVTLFQKLQNLIILITMLKIVCNPLFLVKFIFKFTIFGIYKPGSNDL